MEPHKGTAACTCPFSGSMSVKWFWKCAEGATIAVTGGSPGSKDVGSPKAYGRGSRAVA